MKRHPLLITGPARSGATDLCDLLNIDGRLFITTDTWSHIPEMENNPSIYINLQWTGTIHRMSDLFERHGIPWTDLMPYNIRRSMFNDFLDDRLPESVEYIGDKSDKPYIYASRQIMERATPDTKVLIAMRDGRDVIISEHWGQKAWPHTNETLESWINCAQIIRNYFIAKHSSKCLIVKYDETRGNPPKTVEVISDFLELDKPLCIDGHDCQLVNKNGWKNKYPDMGKIISKTYPEFGDLLKFFGYEI